MACVTIPVNYRNNYNYYESNSKRRDIVNLYLAWLCNN